MNDSRSKTMDCERARRAIHGLLDAEIIDAARKQRLQAHLAECEACRGFESDLRSIQGTLRSMPELKLPEAVLHDVWKQAASEAPPQRTAVFGWKGMAAAAVVLLSMFGVWRMDRTATEPTPDDLARASRQARMVLRLTSEALQRTKTVAVDEVLNDEVSPALRRVPIEWPDFDAAERRGS